LGRKPGPERGDLLGQQDHRSVLHPVIDVLAALRLSSVRVTLASLLGMGKKTVTILSKRRIGELIHQAVSQVIASLPRQRSRQRAEERLERQRAAVEEVRELAFQYEQLSKAKSDLEDSWRSIHDEIGRSRREIHRLKTLSAEPYEDPAVILGAPDVDRRLQGILNDVFLNRSAELVDDSGKEGKRLHSVMEALVLRLAREAREKLRGKLPMTSPLSILERRVVKLFQHEASLADALKALSGPGVRNPQVEGVLRQLGLTHEDPQGEKKKEMLKVVLSANKLIRTTAQELEREGISLSSPRRSTPAA
jgi:hypothetical protein